MIYRNVLFRLTDAADREVIQKILLYAARIRDEIPGVRDYHFAANKAATDGGYDWILLAVFDSVQDMEAYRAHPLHQEFVGFCDAYTDDFMVCVYEVAAA